MQNNAMLSSKVLDAREAGAASSSSSEANVSPQPMAAIAAQPEMGRILNMTIQQQSPDKSHCGTVGCILWGSRVVVPPPLRRQVLEDLHETHPGIVRMKALARSYVWWPGMDEEIEGWVRRCQPCQESRPNPPSAPVHRWESNGRPWSRLHVDFAGPYQGQIFFILVDAYTKWLEVIPVASTSTAAAVRALRRVLCTHGIPDTLVTDNGTAFTSREFREFTDRYLIRHIRSAPFHPATNGQAERMVRTTKEALGRIVHGDWDHRLSAFLFHNRITPNPVTGFSPAELLMGRKLTTRLDRLH
ncbi:LOW QUALITY PROTEIN: uncharacterized protein K02A2.6-like, partial [Heteronotia binoei]|uniref:LOW QUALITY PROTEIN: uncharacterized protein K02A2.6-like n=2 Tax=Heteronotia binoei TaxID=13085 RepID=UPI00292F68E1